MKKIISVFQRNYNTDRLIRDEVVPGAEWVLAGEGVATRKFDGSCCMIKNGQLFKRYELKKGRPAPPNFFPAQGPDPITGDCPGWLPVGDSPEDKWFKKAFESLQGIFEDGTYEAIGPHFQGNPEGSYCDTLFKHGRHKLFDCPRDFNGILEYLRPLDIEGVVFWHPDGRMAKVKKKDFGMKRRPENGSSV